MHGYRYIVERYESVSKFWLVEDRGVRVGGIGQLTEVNYVTFQAHKGYFLIIKKNPSKKIIVIIKCKCKCKCC